MSDKIRVLLAKPGLDGHDRGIKIIAAALRDAGMEVIYTGLRQTPVQIVNAAIQEDVEAVGVSILSGAHMTLFPAILNTLREKGGENILLFGGGIIPDTEATELEKMGVAKLFTPGATTTEIVAWLEKAVEAKQKDEKLL
ncbi:MAG: cobalamin B12-binding domain-containing protein [FCB group bacterium]|nr:cobalamin B12-binding domain-containing protein [FCB group bacterium]